MIDHDAIAARVRQDMKAGTPGLWRVGPVDDTIVTAADGSEVAAVDGDYNEPDLWPIMEANARRIATLPDLEEAYLDLHDEVKRLRAERPYVVGWNAGWDEAQYQAEHGRPSDGDITPKYAFTIAEMAAVEAERDALRAAMDEARSLLVDAMVQLTDGKIKTRRNRALLIQDFLSRDKEPTND